MAASCLEGVHEVQEKERAVLSRLLSSSPPPAPRQERQEPETAGPGGAEPGGDGETSPAVRAASSSTNCLRSRSVG